MAISRALSIGLGAYVGFLIVAFFLQQFDVRRHHIESAWFWFAAALLVFAALAGWQGDTEPRTETRTDGLWVMAVAILSAWFIYFQSLGLGLLSDDFVLLERAERADFWRPGNEFFRPLPLMFWYALNKLAGPWALHFGNVTLHGLVGGLTGMLALKSGWGRPWSLFVAVWLVAQPSTVEAVAWASGVQDLLMAACVVAAVVVVGSRMRYRSLIVIVLLAAALLSKETAVAAPALIAVFWIGGSRRIPHGRWRYAVLGAAVVVIYLVARFLVSPPPGDYAIAPSGYFIKELIVRPFASLAVPWHEHTIADHAILGIASGLFPLVLLLVIVALNRPGALLPVLQFAAWVLFAIAPVYAYFFVSPDLEGSRYLYLATPAWVLLLTEMLRSSLGAHRSWPAVAVASCLVLLSALGVVLNLRPWVAAAELRDVVLQQARAATTASACRTFSFEAVPDSVDGAYVFRNGFDEAVGTLPTNPAGLDCRFRWDGTRFVRGEAEHVR